MNKSLNADIQKLIKDMRSGKKVVADEALVAVEAEAEDDEMITD
ncbi:MAG: hypothetical protein WCJ81_06140 [bacterium]